MYDPGGASEGRERDSQLKGDVDYENPVLIHDDDEVELVEAPLERGSSSIVLFFDSLPLTNPFIFQGYATNSSPSTHIYRNPMLPLSTLRRAV